MGKVNFEKSAKQIVMLVGGNDNVISVSHCITRVRFQLKDNQKVNTEEVKKVDGVMQVIEAGGQYQVVIGTAVEKMYDQVVLITGKGQGEVEPEEKSKKVTDVIMRLVSGIMLPVMPALVGCGMISSIFMILFVCGLVQLDQGFGMILYGIGQTCLYFFPIIIGGSAAKYFKIDTYIGNVIGAALMYTSFITAAAEGVTTNLFGVIPLTFKDYSSTVFPAIVSVWFASIVYKQLKKVIPDVLKFVLVPTLTLFITIPLSLLVIGPVVNTLSGIVSTIILTIYGFSPVLCGAILGGTWLLFIVPLGLHWGFIPIFLNNLVTLGYEPVLGLLQGILSLTGVLIGFGIRSKDKETKSLAFSTAITNTFGISEPGLYGIILQHKETIIVSLIAGAVSGIIPALFHTCVYGMGASGIFGIALTISPDGTMNSLIGAILSNAVGFAVGLILMLVLKYDVDKKA